MSTTTDKHQVSFAQWITDAIKEKMQLKKPAQNIDVLRKVLTSALPKHLATHKDDVTKTRIYEELEGIFWEGRAELLRAAVKAKYSASELRTELQKQLGRAVPPEWVVEWKLHDMKGRTEAPREETENLPGILRVPFTEAPPYSLIKTSFGKPFHALPKSDSVRFRIALISAPQLGLSYDDSDIVHNLTRSGISAARKMRCDALVISGGLFRLAWQKTTGPNRILADLVTGSEIDVESMAANYRARALEIIESGEFKPIFTTALERFKDLLRGWYKVMVRPDKRPEFEGPVYIVLSPDELGLVRRMAYFELLYLQNQELREAQAEETVQAKLSAEAHRYLKEMRNSSSKAGIKAATEVFEEARAEARKASQLVSRMRMTNLDPTQNRRVYDQALSYLIHEIEKNMPTAKVIDQNSAHVVFGKSKHAIKFVSGDRNSPYYDELGGYGPAQRKGQLPALTVVSHPRAVYMRKTSRENYLKGSMLGTVGFVEAPMLVDKDPILEGTRGTMVSLPVVKAVADTMFNGGMLIIKIDPEFGVTPDFISAEAIRTVSAPRRGPPPAPAKKLWLMVATDPHFGGSMRLYLRMPSGFPIALTEAAFYLMKKSGLNRNGVAPVAGLYFCDDLHQGNHYGTHMHPHYNKRPLAQLLMESERALKVLHTIRDPKQREEQMKKMLRETMDQTRYRPPDYLTGQFEELYHGLIRPYADVFKGILLAAKEANVIVTGVSDDQKTPGDTRDVGVINFGSGNHATKTTMGMLHEGPIVAEDLRMRLWSDPALAGINLDRAIAAPLYQDRSIAYGTLKAGDGYTWGLHVSGTPPKRDSWKDVLHGWVAVNRQRGNPSTILNGKSIVHITGDKHFFAGAFAGGDVYVMGPSSTHTDSFAELAGGLPENNAGIAFIGLPVEGPDAGEISVVHLTPTTIQRYLTSGKPFPWDELLPDRV